MGLFTKRELKIKKEFLSHRLVRDSDVELEYEVRDYTSSPSDLIIDLHDLSFLKNRPFIKVKGIVAGLYSKIYGEEDNQALAYEGILAVDDSPIYFQQIRDKKENPELELERMMLEAGKTLPITMTGRIWLPHGLPYSVIPFVLELGDYKVPVVK